MSNSTISGSFAAGINRKEGLELFVSLNHLVSHTNYFGFSLENTTAIKITVGPKDEEISWTLPKSLLTHHSEFFNAALNGTFAESKSNSMTMPEDSPRAFRLFVQWLYVGDIMVNDIDDWLEAWVLGDKLGNIAFRDCAMTKLINGHTYSAIQPETVSTAYRKSVSGSNIRKWALAQLLFDSRSGYIPVSGWIPLVETENEIAVDIAKLVIGNSGDEYDNPHDHLYSYLGN